MVRYSRLCESALNACVACLLALCLLSPTGALAAGCSGKASNHLVEQLAKSGEAAAMTFLGKKFIAPECTTSERKMGIYWLEQAADAGETEALYTLGMLITMHAQSDEEGKLGLDYLQRGAKAGHAAAAAFWGTYLMSVSQNPDMREEALFWLGSAASNGSVLAAMTVAQLYSEGMHGVPRDLCSAELWSEAAFLVQHPDKEYLTGAPGACE